MLKLKKRNVIIADILALLITFMQVAGWQISMDYGSSVHQSGFFQNIGVLETWQCVFVGSMEWVVLSVLFYVLFSWLEKRESVTFESVKAEEHAVEEQIPRFFVFFVFGVLFVTWMIFLWGCYPGFYNYDIGNQLPQFLYEEVQYNAHHPLLHTLLCGSIISLGYHIYTTDISFGVFLYNAFQMMICAACLSYSIKFIYERTRNRILTIFTFVFYAICPPIVMFAMSTTKDVLCHSVLLVAIIRFLELYKEIESGKATKAWKWGALGGLLAISCLLRKNIIYAIVVFAVLSLVLLKKERKKQIMLYLGVIAVYFVVDKGLLYALDAIPGSINEAMCVPYQQIARLYTLEGKDAFTEEEYALLSEVIEPDALFCYDPVMGDHTKANFNPGLETIMNNKLEYLTFWLKKGLEYPKIYLDAILYNTYQAWYPGTQITEARGVRYFDVTGWSDKYGTPHWQGLFDFYIDIRWGAYIQYPVIRLFFSTGAMFWMTVIAWFYGIWRKDKGIIAALLLVLLVCGTTFLGPVSDVRYYLILFYLMPVCLGLMLQKKNGKITSQYKLET